MTEMENLLVAQKVTEAMKLIKNGCLAQRTGLCRDFITRVTHIGKHNYEPPKERSVALMNQAFTEIADDIDTYMVLHYGDDVPAKLKEWRKVINLPYIFCDVLGKHVMWYKKRMREKPMIVTCGKEYCYYNDFTEQDIRDINNAIKVVSTKLRAIHLP